MIPIDRFDGNKRMQGETAGLCPGPRKGTCPLDPVANAAVENVQI